LLEGRGLNAEDLDSRRPVAVVNAAFTRKHFGTESAIGRRFRTVDFITRKPNEWRTIIGVVSTIRMLGPFNNPGVDDSGYYLPFYSNVTGPAGELFANQFATVVVKPRGGQRADAMANVLRRYVNKVDSNLPLYFVGTPKVQIEGFVAQNRIIATMFSIFGLVAVVLASVGMYGVMSFSVNQRRQEFGVRMALGADHGRILSMVLKQGIIQLVVGLGLGLGIALTIAAIGRSGIQNTLFGVSARDPFTYTVVLALITLVAVTATLVPARRATRVDPMVALRTE
jgi:putative ABC transport system permease protein